VCTFVGTESREGHTHTTDTLIPKNWMPEAQDVLFAARIGLDVERQIPLFVDSHAGSKGVRTCADTAAAWRNWCRIAAERAQSEAQSWAWHMIFNREGMERAMD
jgi:hypothetical protein